VNALIKLACDMGGTWKISCIDFKKMWRFKDKLKNTKMITSWGFMHFSPVQTVGSKYMQEGVLMIQRCDNYFHAYLMHAVQKMWLRFRAARTDSVNQVSHHGFRLRPRRAKDFLRSTTIFVLQNSTNEPSSHVGTGDIRRVCACKEWSLLIDIYHRCHMSGLGGI